MNSNSHELTNAEKKGPLAWMAGNSVAANLLMLVFLVGGYIWMSRIKQEVFPEMELDNVTVQVAYPGATPEDVEESIIKVVEGKVRGLDNVKEIRSTAVEGNGTVVVEMVKGGNLDKLSKDVKNAVDRIATFPQDTEEPQVAVSFRKLQTIEFVVSGQLPERVLREKAEVIRDRLLQNPGITQVEMSNTREFEVSVEISMEKLRCYNLRLSDIADKIRNSAKDIPAGGMKTRSGEILVRMKERRDFAREFARIPVITTAEGAEIQLSEIATITDDFEDRNILSYYNGKPAVILTVYRVGDQTPIQVADDVREVLDQIRPSLPAGLDVAIFRDMSEIYRQRINLLMRNAYIGLALVLILLSCFLEIRLAFWVTMGIPISFMGTFLIMPFFGVSINMISLFAFIIALGIVVDDAIVVGENVYKYHQQGIPFRVAAVRGAREVKVPVVFSVLTNIAAFMPLMFVEGRMGKIIIVIPIVVCSTFTISLIESLLILPAHLGHHRERKRKSLNSMIHHTQQRFSHWFNTKIKTVYGPVLNFILTYRYLTISAGASIMITCTAYVATGHLPVIFMPRTEADVAYCEVTFPDGTPLVKIKQTMDILLAKAIETAEDAGGSQQYKGVTSDIVENKTHVSVEMTQPDIRTIPTTEFISNWRAKIGRIPGIENMSMQSDRGGPGAGPAYSLELSHRDVPTLEKACEELGNALKNYPEASDIDNGFALGKKQLNFKIKPEAESLGLTVNEIGRQLRNAFYGAEAIRQQLGRNELRVRVKLPKEERNSEWFLNEMMLQTPDGINIPLMEVVDFIPSRAFTRITRREGRRVMTVSCEITPRGVIPQIKNDVEENILPGLMQKYPGLGFSYEGRQKDLAESNRSLAYGLVAALLVIYALLGVPLRSYTQPLIIMVSVPFGVIGAIIGHILMGYELSLMSFFGILALCGIVVNDSLVLVEFTNRLRQKGLSAREAIKTAGIARFRPIMLTTLSTFFGLLPMIFETSRQAKFLIPMAISLGFGVVFATCITLMLVPSFYMLVEDCIALSKRFMQLWGFRE